MSGQDMRASDAVFPRGKTVVSNPSVVELEGEILMPRSYAPFLASLGFKSIDESVRPNWVAVSFSNLLSHKQALSVLRGAKELLEEEEEASSEELDAEQVEGRGVKRRRIDLTAPTEESLSQLKEEMEKEEKEFPQE